VTPSRVRSTLPWTRLIAARSVCACQPSALQSCSVVAPLPASIANSCAFLVPSRGAPALAAGLPLLALVALALTALFRLSLGSDGALGSSGLLRLGSHFALSCLLGRDHRACTDPSPEAEGAGQEPQGNAEGLFARFQLVSHFAIKLHAQFANTPIEQSETTRAKIGVKQTLPGQNDAAGKGFLGSGHAVVLKHQTHFLPGDAPLIAHLARCIVLTRTAFGEMKAAGFISDGKVSPWFQVLQHAAKEMRATSRMLSLSPASYREQPKPEDLEVSYYARMSLLESRSDDEPNN
jgi:hypothetical protein